MVAAKGKGKTEDKTSHGPVAPRDRHNPFEQKFQRLKHHVLGQKVKGVRGRTILARTRAFEMVGLVLFGVIVVNFGCYFQRKETLGVELSQSNKKNVFHDARFGEKDDKMSAEDKMMMRFQKERHVLSLFTCHSYFFFFSAKFKNGANSIWTTMKGTLASL